MSPIKKKGRDPRASAPALICADLRPPATAATQPTEKEFGVSGLSETQPDGARKTAPKSTCLQRASSETIRLLGTRNPSILIADEGKAHAPARARTRAAGVARRARSGSRGPGFVAGLVVLATDRLVRGWAGVAHPIRRDRLGRWVSR